MDILISEELDAPAVTALAAKYKVSRQGTLWKSPADLKTAIAGARAILVRNQTQLTADILNAAPQLQVIGRIGVGLDNIDVATATRLGIAVLAPLDANAVSVAELTMAFALALARKIPVGDRSTKAGGWDRKGCTGVELAGKTFAICGFGRIGRKVAHFAKAFGMTSVVFDPFVKAGSPQLEETGARLVGSLDEALAAADFLTTHSPLTPETKHMFNQATFAKMKKGAFFINTSRGGVVDESALIEALRSGHLGGAALDVRETEPPGKKSALDEMDNVIVAPHIGAFTAESQTRTFEAVCSDVDRVLAGEAATNFVNMPRPKR